MLNELFIFHLLANSAHLMLFLRLVITLSNLKYLHWICMILYHADGLSTLSYKIQQLLLPCLGEGCKNMSH